ncbi:MAG TPA: hypothetical protein DCY79_23585 [Planctomycetaceae bacterium]|nr:hypothetical protein [Blastopirellula sp.]HAY82803.1 hypothetical protein [Planctomycetaceae bacterium]
MTDCAQNLRKAAILVSCLPDHEANGLLDGMAPTDAAQIRATLTELDDVSQEEQESVLTEFLRGDATPAETAADGVEMDLSVEGRIAAEDTPLAIDKPPSDLEQPPSDLEHVECTLLTRVLADEHPQTIAVVLARQTAERASQILLLLPLTTQADVARRLRSMHMPPTAVVELIDTALATKLREQATHLHDEAFTTWDQILDAVEPTERQHLLERLTDADTASMPEMIPEGPGHEAQSEVANDLNEYSFSFADLMRLDDQTLLQVLTDVDQKVILLALTGAPRQLVDRLLTHLPADEAQLFEQRCESIGPLNLRDVEFAQQTLVACTQRLALQGQIQLPLLDERRVA